MDVHAGAPVDQPDDRSPDRSLSLIREGGALDQSKRDALYTHSVVIKFVDIWGVERSRSERRNQGRFPSAPRLVEREVRSQAQAARPPPRRDIQHMNPAAEPVRKFNPGTGQSDREVVDQFVVRKHELDIVLDILKSNIDVDCCQSTLVVAPRGAGKTMLLARVAAELRANPAFAPHLLPVRLMEENHEAYDIGEFYLEVLFHLVLEIEAAMPDIARDLRHTHEDLCARWRPDLAPQALGALLGAADRLDRRLVLLVENLQSLCRDTDDDFGWSLRGTLQTEPRIMLVASATARFQELRRPNEPFFELFRFVELKPLNSDACLRLWRTVSGDDAPERTIRPLEIFTGGSPRLLVVVAEFSLHRSLPRLMEELVTLIDDHTEYFRGRLERLPKGERRVYVAIIDLWQPSGTGEISTRARMGVRAVSTCIGRLVERGLVAPRGTGHRKRYLRGHRRTLRPRPNARRPAPSRHGSRQSRRRAPTARQRGGRLGELGRACRPVPAR